jgi:oxygen-independent coproporphyrinogen-3 oxidase
MMPKSDERHPGESRGLYIHIPFCHARCGYCDFVTFTGKEDRIDQYVEDLCKEIRLYSGELASEQAASEEHRSPLAARGSLISTVFFGGGTPSLLEPRHVSQILETVRSHFALDPNAEITMEANPESIALLKAQGWKEAGVNRMSIGLQAFDDNLLRAADRLHTVADFLAAFDAARQAGFQNLNIDLIYGLPGQTLESWRETLKKSVAMKPEHLSLYALKVEEHTPFHVQGAIVDDDLQADMYEWSRIYLKEAGYPQYEISNFARPDFECHHNLIYWRQQDYLGLGVGAVGCVAGQRWENHKNLLDYTRDLSRGKLPRAATEMLDDRTRRFERLMLGLRLREGLLWGEEANEVWRTHRATLAARELLEEIHPGHWRIPDSAVAVTNQILLPFA